MTALGATRENFGQWTQFKRRITQGSVILAIVLALFASLEAAARFAQFVRSQVRSTGAPLVLKRQWGKQLSADQARLRWRHENYVEFRERPMESVTTNVGENGTRVVPGSCQSPKGETFLLLLFGGSTMFGYGVPDQFTIPAYLARSLNHSDRCVKVINYGAAWWQSSQSVSQLLKVLREGIRPSAVVFYDGINDVDVVAFGGSPGGIAPEAELLLRNVFEEDVEWGKIIQNSVLVRVTARWLFGDRTKSAANVRVIDRAGLHKAAKGISQVYVYNVRIVEALARDYGFNAYFFLQPFSLIAGKTNTELESVAIRNRTQHREGEVELVRAAYEEWRNDPYLKRHRQFYDISRLFEGMTQEVYADTEHLLPEGNRLVAERIANEIRLNEWYFSR